MTWKRLLPVIVMFNGMVIGTAVAVEVSDDHTDQDPGDEDDGPPRPRWPYFWTGTAVIRLPARRLPAPPDHDPGDEEPRLEPLDLFAEVRL